MKVPEVYERLMSEAGELAPSITIALLPPGVDEPTVAGVQDRLRASGLEVDGFEVVSRPQDEGAIWKQSVEVTFPGLPVPTRFEVWLEKSPDDLPMVDLEERLTDEESEAAANSRWSLATLARLGDEPLADFHRQLRFLTALAPDAVVVADAPAMALHSGAWLRDVASASVPPAPIAMLRLHSVGPDDDGRDWIHSHGLLRCGCIELEMIDVPEEDGGAMGELINAVAAMFLDLGVPPPGETFTVGGQLDMVWLPWEEGIRHGPEGMWGDEAERQEGHFLPSGILFLPPRGLFRKRYGNPSTLARRLEDNPVLWISDAETERMSVLAKERFERFRAIHERYGSDDEDWVFLIKLGLSVDDSGDPPEREHLWFHVHSITDDEIDATLINEPYGIAAMREGDRATHSLEPMSDWTILCEHGRFDPDTIFHLERELEGEGSV